MSPAESSVTCRAIRIAAAAAAEVNQLLDSFNSATLVLVTDEFH